MASKDDAGAPGPLTQRLAQTAAHYGGYRGSTDGDSAAEVFAQGVAELGLDPDNPLAGGEEDDPLKWAAMSVSQKMSALPAWARDLKVMGINATSEPDPFVFVGDTEVPAVRGEFDTPRGLNATVEGQAAGEVTKAQTVTRAQNLPYTWDEEQVDDAIKRFQEAGLQVTSFQELETQWNMLVDRASAMYMLSDGEKKVTPWDVLDLVKREDETANGTGEDELDPNRRTVTKSKSISEISEGEAWNVLQTNLSRMLGRDPSDQEVRDFTHRMNTLAAANPAITKTIEQYKNGEVVSQTERTVKAGLTGQDMMRASYEDAQKDPEYGAYQAASTYYNSAVQALGAIGDV